MIPARVLGTGAALAGAPRTTAELVAHALPGRDPAEVERRIGIRTRHWVPPDVTAAALGAAAASKALAAAGLAAADLRRILFVSSTGGDSIIPATANAVAEALELDGTCDAFDLNNGCAGFLTAFDLAARSVATGLGPVAVVASETLSRTLPPAHPRPYLVLADAAGAVIVGRGSGDEGVVATVLRNTAALRGRVRMGPPGTWGRPNAPPGEPPALLRASAETPFVRFDASYAEMTRSALDALVRVTTEACAEAGIAAADAEWFLPHQPNGRMLERVLDVLRIDPARTVSVVDEVGSVAAASIPVSLDRLLRTRPVRPGDRILMATVGAGTAAGATLLRLGPIPPGAA